MCTELCEDDTERETIKRLNYGEEGKVQRKNKIQKEKGMEKKCEKNMRKRMTKIKKSEETRNKKSRERKLI
jgi:hypothetical protein